LPPSLPFTLHEEKSVSLVIVFEELDKVSLSTLPVPE